MTVALVALAVLCPISFYVGYMRGRTGRARWLDRQTRSERAIDEAKTLYANGQIELADLETRVGHLTATELS